VRAFAGSGLLWIGPLLGAVQLLPCLILAGLLGSFGGVLAPLHDLDLDRLADTAPATITAQRVLGSIHSGGRHPTEYRFRFALPGEQDQSGQCYAWEPLTQDAPVVAEYLPERPAICRLASTRRSAFETWNLLLFLLLAVVGCGLIVIGMIAIEARRQLLTNGVSAAGTVTKLEPTRFLNPPHVRVSFQFTTAEGTIHPGHTMIHARNPVLRDLAVGDGVDVVHDRHHPERHSLVAPNWLVVRG
jgi:hypothetical protein